MWEISKDFAFSASHVLHGLPDGHPCGRMHGHNYIVRVTLAGGILDRSGFVLDYGLLKPFGEWIDGHLDHRHLNDAVDVQPSAENLAYELATILREVVDVPPRVAVAVGVSETPKTWATYR